MMELDENTIILLNMIVFFQFIYTAFLFKILKHKNKSFFYMSLYNR